MKRNKLKQMYYKETSNHYKDKDGYINKEYLNWIEDKYIELMKQFVKNLKH